MATPEVHIYVWFIAKTETPKSASEGGIALTGDSRLRRPDEKSKSSFRMDVQGEDILTSLTITDGIGETDDAFSLSLTEAGWKYFLNLWFRVTEGERFYKENLYGSRDYSVIGIIIGNRFFGPYDVESFNFNGDDSSVTMSGRIDREFEDTVIDTYPDVFFFPAKQNTKLRLLLNAAEPYRSWNRRGVGVIDIIMASVGQSKDLGGLRNALSPYGIGVSPHTIPLLLNKDLTIQRDIDLYMLYPSLINDIYPTEQTLLCYVTGFRNNELFRIGEQEIRRWRSISDDMLWREAPPSLSVPDANNLPDDFISRRIDVGIRDLYTNQRIYSSGTQLPRVILEPGGQQIQFALAVENARWKLQNTAARGTLTLEGDAFLISGQLITIDRRHLLWPHWRIESVKHSITPDSGFVSTLELAMTQGLYSPDASVSREITGVPTISNQAPHVPGASPDLESSPWWQSLWDFTP